MITFFSVPKAFESHTGIIQRNAIQSWREIHPDAEIVLFGNENGSDEIARGVKAKKISKVPCNRFGTPLLNYVFREIEKIASYETLCYLNSDIILAQSLNDLSNKIQLNRFLMIGRRINLEVKSDLNFIDPSWNQKLLGSANELGAYGHDSEMDYFFYKKNTLPISQMPAFAVGRPCWDNWLVYQARQSRIPVVDATSYFRIIHQNHSYKRDVKSSRGVWIGDESKENLRLAGDLDYCFTLRDADWEFNARGELQKKSFQKQNLFRSFFVWMLLYHKHPWFRFAIQPILYLRLQVRYLVRFLRNNASNHVQTKGVSA